MYVARLNRGSIELRCAAYIHPISRTAPRKLSPSSAHGSDTRPGTQQQPHSPAPDAEAGARPVHGTPARARRCHVRDADASAGRGTRKGGWRGR